MFSHTTRFTLQCKWSR